MTYGVNALVLQDGHCSSGLEIERQGWQSCEDMMQREAIELYYYKPFSLTTSKASERQLMLLTIV